MVERLGFPHPGPLPEGDGAKGASPTVSSLILGPTPDEREVSSALCKGGDW